MSEKPHTTIYVRLPESLKRSVTEQAKKRGLSLTTWVILALEKALKESQG